LNVGSRHGVTLLAIPQRIFSFLTTKCVYICYILILYLNLLWQQSFKTPVNIDNLKIEKNEEIVTVDDIDFYGNIGIFPDWERKANAGHYEF
jgi:hypothetical protein